MYIGNNLKSTNQTPTTIETLGRLLENEGYSLTYASSQNNKIVRLMDMVFTCFKNRENTDYVLIDTYSTLNFYYALITALACRMLKLPYICILHGGNLENRLQRNSFLTSQLFGRAYKLVAPSRFLQTIFKKYGYEDVVFIPNTLPLENYPFIKRDKISPKLLWVRSFSRIYNPKMAVDVASILKDRYKKISLCMVGPEKDGAMAETKNYAKEKGISVNFTGKLSKPEWTLLSREYDIFINTTNIDNTPVSVIEAMALGLPVVSTRVGGIPFLLSDNENALLVPKADAEAMADAISKLVENSDLAMNIAYAARKRAKTFNWETVRNKWFKILGDVV